MVIVDIHEASTHLSQLLERAMAGEEIIIARRGYAVARLVPFTPLGTRRVFGRLRGKIRVADDFDAPLPDDVLAGFQGDSIASGR
jgi:prevent-host-death family protein